jgi:hypothetical protein
MKEYKFRYTLLDGSPREFWGLKAESEQAARQQAHEMVKRWVSESYDVRNIKFF